MNTGIAGASYERHGEWWTYCSRAARERGLPLRLLGSERHAVVLAGARGYTCVGSRRKSRTHSRLQTMYRRAQRREWSTGIFDRGGRRVSVSLKHVRRTSQSIEPSLGRDRDRQT